MIEQIQSEHKQEVLRVNDESSVKTESSVSVSQGGEERKETIKSASGANLALAQAPAAAGGPSKPTRKSTAPRFVTPLNGRIVDQGADILLEGILDGLYQMLYSTCLCSGMNVSCKLCLSF